MSNEKEVSEIVGSFLEFKGEKMKLNKYIDHIKPGSNKEQIEKIIEEARIRFCKCLR